MQFCRQGNAIFSTNALLCARVGFLLPRTCVSLYKHAFKNVLYRFLDFLSQSAVAQYYLLYKLLHQQKILNLKLISALNPCARFRFLTNRKKTSLTLHEKKVRSGRRVKNELQELPNRGCKEKQTTVLFSQLRREQFSCFLQSMSQPLQLKVSVKESVRNKLHKEL